MRYPSGEDDKKAGYAPHQRKSSLTPDRVADTSQRSINAVASARRG
jgi:hypothetical protein